MIPSRSFIDVDPEQNIWPLLDRYFSAECSTAEREVIGRWVGDDPERAAELERLRQLWLRVGSVVDRDQYDTESAWRKTGLGVLAEHVAPLALLRPSPRPRWLRLAMIAASVVAAAVLGAVTVVRLDLARRTYATSRAQQLTIELTDGSRVTLAPESQLRLARAFGHSRRDLTLVGEAYFVVRHDPTRPFAVHTARTTAVDIGTEFDIRAYTHDSTERVFVAQGRVNVVSDAEVALASGQAAVIDASRHLIRETQVDVAARTAWRDGRLAYHDAPVSEIVSDLDRWYDVDIALADPDLAAERLTAEWTNVPGDRVLKELAAAINAQIERHGRRVTLTRRLRSANPE